MPSLTPQTRDARGDSGRHLRRTARKSHVASTNPSNNSGLLACPDTRAGLAFLASYHLGERLRVALAGPWSAQGKRRFFRTAIIFCDLCQVDFGSYAPEYFGQGVYTENPKNERRSMVTFCGVKPPIQ
jgi:hypothetical protein